LDDSFVKSEIEALQKLPLLNAFGPDAIAELYECAESMKLAAGEVLFRKGDRSEGGYLVVSGCIELCGASDGGPRLFVYPGSLIGELSLLAEQERSADAVAHERSEVRKILRTHVRRILQKDALIATRLRVLLETKASDLAQALQSFSSVAR
jgi:CRP-like cAMP-binding protein